MAGRPELPPEERRNPRRIRMTDREWERVCEAAARCGASASAWAVGVLSLASMVENRAGVAGEAVGRLLAPEITPADRADAARLAALDEKQSPQ
jgi:hypothetical protein